MRFNLKCGVAFFAMVAAASPVVAMAQNAQPAETEENYGLSEITVTAQRRTESVQDVPIAISAFDSNELATRGVSSALEVTQFVPNLVGINNTGLGSANSY